MAQKPLSLPWIMAAILFFICFGCAGDSGREATHDKAEEVEATPAAASKEVTDDIYVEIAARQMYLTHYYSEEMEGVSDQTKLMQLTTEMGQELSALYDEFEVTEDAVYNYLEDISDDISAYTDIMGRVQKRFEELLQQ